MTAITINLLAEEQLSQQADARNPVKLCALVGIGLIGLTTCAGVIVGLLAQRRSNEAAALQGQWDSLESKEPNGTGTDTKALRAVANDYVAINQERMLYGPQLALIKDVIPESVQLVTMRFMVVTESVLPNIVLTPGMSAAKAARAAKPIFADHLHLILEGIASSDRPELEVDSFIKNLRGNKLFTKFVSDVRLKSIARVDTKTGTGSASLLTANFTIECLYKGNK